MDEDSLRAMMPMSFGKAQKPRGKPAGKAAASASGPLRPHPRTDDPITRPIASSSASKEEYDDDGLTAEEREANRTAANRDDNGKEDDDSDDDVDLGPEPQGPSGTASSLPIEDKVILRDHSKAVSALSVDAAGARVATGSYDYDVKLWDFGGMSQTFKPFKTFEPAESHLVHDVAWSPNGGDQLLVATGTAQARLYDRDGYAVATYKKGDVYIRDMKNTSGHVAELTSCFWHPSNKQSFATTSADSTVRIWNVETIAKQETVVVVKSKERGTRTKVTCGAYSHDGGMLSVGCLDGALHLYSASGTFSRPNASIEGAHARNTETSSTVFSKDGRTLATRGGDGTVKLWDVRMFKKPLATRQGLHNAYGQTNVIFSPDESVLLTGTSVERVETRDGSMGKVTKEGAIEVLSRASLEPLQQIHPTESDGSSASIIRLAWNSRINQLFATSSSGAVHLFFSRSASSRGALLCIDKHARTRARYDDADDVGADADGVFRGPIITPGASDALSRGQGVGSAAKKRKMEKMRQDQGQTRIPERPLEGQGRGGRIGAAATQHMAAGMFKSDMRAEDPREALLKYADKEASDPQWTRAWKKTAMEPVSRQDDEADKK